MIRYRDKAVFYKVESTGYANSKEAQESGKVNVVFIQNTAFLHTDNQDAIDSDGVIYSDPQNTFIKENAYRLEGMVVKIEMFGSSSDASWYKITQVAINRDHLLGNNIDNVECLLKKTRPLNDNLNS